MAKNEKMKCDSGCCSMHICGKCAPMILVFGILFLIGGFGLWTGAPAWFNFETIVGVFLALWGLIAMTMMKN